MRPLPMSGALIYAILFWSAYALWVALETVASLKKRSADKSRALDRGSYKLVMGLLWLGITFDFALAFLLPKASIRWERIPLFFVGIALMLGGIAFRFYSMHVLGRFFTYDVSIQADQTVVAAGPYRYIRHPSYTGALVTLIGLGLALGNWAGLVALLTCMGIGYAYRISVEEAALVTSLGDPYRQYMHRTRRLVPFVF